MITMFRSIAADLRLDYETVRSLIWKRGHWGWKHDFKSCPLGDRHCGHYRWVRDPK